MRPESEVSDFERLQVLDSPQAERLETRAQSRTLYRQSGYLLRDLADLHVEPDGGIEQPIDLPFRRANPIFMLSQAKQGAVVDEMPGLVAPNAIGDPVRLELAHIAGDQAVEVGQRIRPRHAVLHHGCQVVERRRVANREVFL